MTLWPLAGAAELATLLMMVVVVQIGHCTVVTVVFVAASGCLLAKPSKHWCFVRGGSNSVAHSKLAAGLRQQLLNVVVCIFFESSLENETNFPGSGVPRTAQIRGFSQIGECGRINQVFA